VSGGSLRGVAPTELLPGEDPVARFLAEIEAVSGTWSRVAPDRLAEDVRAAVAVAGARSVALTADLGGARAAIGAALRADGLDVTDYEAVAGDRDRVRHLEATVTGCLAAVAATGSVVTGGAAGRGGALVAPVHLCVVEARRLVDGLADLMRLAPRLGAGLSALALQSGPSRTADIEKTLVLGMHGPRHVHVTLLDGELDAVPPAA
jgi:L-lactate utilization protein LutC